MSDPLMGRWFLFLGATGGFLAVALGAFAAHALRARLDEYARGIFDTAVQYHFVHAVALLFVGLLLTGQPSSTLLRSSGWFFLVGTVVFSGSLYLLAVTGTRWLGAVTPVGGLAFLAGWACLAAAAWKVLPAP